MSYSQSNFTSFLDDVNGLATKNRFELVAFIPPSVAAGVANISSTLNLSCESAMMPSKRILTMDGIGAKSTYKYPYGYSNGDMTFSFLLDGNYTAKEVFENWVSRIVDNDSKEVSFHDEIVAGHWEMYQHGMNQQKIYGVKLYNVYPVDISEISFSNAESNAVQQINISIVYSKSEKI